jgi:hypothetical protein
MELSSISSVATGQSIKHSIYKRSGSAWSARASSRTLVPHTLVAAERWGVATALLI